MKPDPACGGSFAAGGEAIEGAGKCGADFCHRPIFCNACNGAPTCSYPRYRRQAACPHPQNRRSIRPPRNRRAANCRRGPRNQTLIWRCCWQRHDVGEARRRARPAAEIRRGRAAIPHTRRQRDEQRRRTYHANEAAWIHLLQAASTRWRKTSSLHALEYACWARSAYNAGQAIAPRLMRRRRSCPSPAARDCAS